MEKRSTENGEMAPGYYKETSFFPTTIPGVYAMNVIPVAVRTPAYKLLQKYGAVEGESILARFYDLPERSVNAKAMLDAKAAEMGATVVGYFDGSLAKIDSKEKLTDLDSDETFELYIGAGTADPTTKLAAIRVQEGGVVDVLADQNPDTDILSILTTPNKASYAVVIVDGATDLSADVSALAAENVTAEDIIAAGGSTGNAKMDEAMAAFINSCTEEQLAQLLALGGDLNKINASDPTFTAFLESLTEEQLFALMVIGMAQ